MSHLSLPHAGQAVSDKIAGTKCNRASLKWSVCTGLSIVLQLKSCAQQSPIKFHTHMATTETFSILAYCFPTVHGALAASWSRSSKLHSLAQLNPILHRRMAFMVFMSSARYVAI
jgi:hypothetical protein